MNPTIRNRRAFPEAQPEGYQKSRGDAPGMTLRQYYAGQILVGLLAANPQLDIDQSMLDKAFVTTAVRIADALCEELAK